MERYRTARNVAIIAAIAAAVYFLPGGGRAASTVQALLGVAIGVAIALLAARAYLENRVALQGLGDRHRGLLYGAVALAFFEYMARSRMWQSGLGELVWFILAGAIVYSLMEVYRHSRTY